MRPRARTAGMQRRWRSTWSVSLQFNVEYQAVHPRDAQLLPAAHGAARAHLPLLALHAGPAFALEIIQRLAARADHLLAAADDRAPAALHQHADDQNQEA